MRYLFILVGIIFLQSCSSETQKEPFASMVKPCDQVNIVLYNGGDSLFFETKDSNGIEILTQLLSGKTESLKDTCSVVGEFRYLTNKNTFYTAPFALDSLKNSATCNYVSYSFGNQQYKHRLTERAENLLRQMYAAKKVAK